MTVTRRDVLKGVAALAIGACSSSSTAGGEDGGEPDAGVDARPVVPPEGTPLVAQFPLGVSAGDLAGDRVVVWCRYAGMATLTAVLWRVDGDTYLEELGPFAATPTADGFTHVAVTGLAAGARYRYAFFEVDGSGARTGRSLIGAFRAPIAAESTETLTFGAISCTEASRSQAPIRRAAERAKSLDAFLFLGDNVYCDGATEIRGYREKYVGHIGRDAHVALRAAVGQYITWDDHEIANDFNPETSPLAQLDAAFQCFFEHAPITRDPQAPYRIWRSARWGKTLEVFVLESRSGRMPSTRTTPQAQYLAPEQLTWLEAGLAASPCTFKVIMNSVPITNMPNLWNVAPQDRWEGYQAQRDRILSFIDTRQIGGVLWVAGDFHLAFISKVSASGPGATQREVLVGPGGQTTNPLFTTLFAPQFQYTTGTNNMTTLRFDPGARTVTVTYVNGDGDEFHSESIAL